jgi:hypothetical protein
MRNVAMPMSYITMDECVCDYVLLVLWVQWSRGKRGRTDLKDVLERVCHFPPFVDEMFMPLAHDEV